MVSYDLNSLPEQLKKGLITKSEVIRKVSCFITKNYKVFNLQKYDEDLRSDLVITFLENGENFINSYKPEIGDFFTFLYCYVNSIATTKFRSLSQKNLRETIVMAEGITNLSDKENKYSEYSYRLSEIPKAPYSYKPSNLEELKKIFRKLNQESSDKKILVLAMKSSMYLSDSQIQKICKLYKLDVEDFYKLIEYFKDNLSSKIEKRAKAEERRNFAYYHHKKYTLQLEKLENEDTSEKSNNLTSKIKVKESKHEKNWIKMNKKLEDGYLYLRPTTKSVADILGICERQVTYYINCAKKEAEELNNLQSNVL